MKPTFFIFGYGYTAEFLAKNLNSVPTSRGIESESTPEPSQTFPCSNFNIVGTTHKAKLDMLGKRIDFLSPDVENHLSQATHILITIPPGKTEGDRVLAYYKEAIQRHSAHIQWIWFGWF